MFDFFTFSTTSDGRRSKLSQLRGAVALMVLLGLTWSLGAASAANYRQYDNDDPPVTAIALQVNPSSLEIINSDTLASLEEGWGGVG